MEKIKTQIVENISVRRTSKTNFVIIAGQTIGLELLTGSRNKVYFIFIG
jgi:hypothetical protein